MSITTWRPLRQRLHAAHAKEAVRSVLNAERSHRQKRGAIHGHTGHAGGFMTSVMLGPTDITPASLLASMTRYDPTQVAHIILRTERLPRALVAVLVGASLAIAGALMQTMTRNPLASPGILGINAGAMFLLSLPCRYCRCIRQQAMSGRRY